MAIFFNDFDGFFELGFGKPSKVIFNTAGLKDQMPACWNKTKTGYKARIKTLGVERVNVTVEDYGIKIFGENEIDGQKYDTTIELPISQDVMNNVIEIKHNTTAGITIVELIVSRPEKKNIKINRI